jgi:hypothetical protein
MGNIAKWFEKMAGNEPILCAVLGRHDNPRWGDECTPHAVGKVLPWAEARALLDYEYDSGFGSANCHPVFAWTETKLLTITEYDGATGPAWFPRNPMDVTPGFDGVDTLEI